MEDKRVQEANNNFKTYIQDGLIKKQICDEKIFETYMKNSNESLEVAQLLFDKNISSLWVIVIAYYSMFYITNAYFLKLGYKVGHKIAHKITADSLIVLVKDKLQEKQMEEFDLAVEDALEISQNLIDNFDYERVKRSKIQYETTTNIKYSKAQTSLKRAKEFIFEMKKLMYK